MAQSRNIRYEVGALEVDGHVISRQAQVSTLTEAATLTAEGSGKTYILSAATEFAVTLPAVADASGFHATFIVGAAPSGASYTIVSPATDIHGVVITANVDAGSAASSTGGTAVDTITLVDAKAAVGDSVEISSDGTAYYVRAYSTLFDGITLS